MFTKCDYEITIGDEWESESAYCGLRHDHGGEHGEWYGMSGH